MQQSLMPDNDWLKTNHLYKSANAYRKKVSLFKIITNIILVLSENFHFDTYLNKLRKLQSQKILFRRLSMIPNYRF